ncbi:MAG: hypothetical protein FWG68_01965, partial [Defluviitaleaceae bacterium]|nr:hypothetical protein [Defluviitaleaceae bacterium]
VYPQPFRPFIPNHSARLSPTIPPVYPQPFRPFSTNPPIVPPTITPVFPFRPAHLVHINGIAPTAN